MEKFEFYIRKFAIKCHKVATVFGLYLAKIGLKISYTTEFDA